MALRMEQRKADLIDRVASAVREHLPKDRAAEAECFVRLFYRHVPPADILPERAEDLYGAAVALWQFGARRKARMPKVRAYNPTYDEHGWQTNHTVVEVVNDDMPFLVDSLTQALNLLGLNVHLAIHPVVAISRDRRGVRTALLDAPDAPDAQAESYMHIEVDEQTSTAALARIETTLSDALADVRAAVSDWALMKERLDELIGRLETAAPPVPAEEVSEAIAFLRWLTENQFTFLGYREYGFQRENGELDLKILAHRGLGVLRDPEHSVFEGLRRFAQLPPEVQQFMTQPLLLTVTKGNMRAKVHRAVSVDAIIVKTFDDAGAVTGELVFCGLFTSTAYLGDARTIPFLRQKIARVLSRSGLNPRGHDGKALAHILSTYPRDELFQASDDELLDMAVAVLHLQERQSTALFVRRDPYERFLSCLVYIPRDRYNTELRERIQSILENAFEGSTATFSINVGDAAHARVHFNVDTVPGRIPDVPVAEVEAQIVEAARTWSDRLREALVDAKGEEAGLALFRRYGDAFPTAYRETTVPPAAIGDVERLEQVLEAGGIALNLYRPIGAAEHYVRFKLYHAGGAVPLTDILPMLERMGFKVISEIPYEVHPQRDDEQQLISIHDFGLETDDCSEIYLGKVRQPLLEAFGKVWDGVMESDGFNRLVLRAGLLWREVVVLRAYGRYLRQVRFAFSQSALEETLAGHPRIARLIADLFTARFDPAAGEDRDTRERGIAVEVEHALDAVENLDEDRILRRFVNLVHATLRTNFYQRMGDGQPKPYLAVKIDSQAVDELPKPRPRMEIFVYSPRLEAVHLRGGKVARGGIRWSDRREDFRTEILGLMKAQMVKNAVIVPVGSKGGFVVKRPPPAAAGRDAALAEGVACYKTMMRGLLDLTDNLVDGRVVPPADVVRHDGDDPYLVVAADKGTATFSDIANGIAAEYGFWLDDAFASGGSAGYDHKKMGITARGAWESVKRHFRELGTDIQREPFTVVGIGDMSGDVFGNGMLLSEQIRMVAAFNHLHVFVDPDPDPAIGFAERKRLFEQGRGSWDQYDAAKLSPGGGVFDRRAKSIRVSEEMRQRFGIDRHTLTPNELIAAILRAEVDLLWFGGIGTFIKAHDESHADAGDKANDTVRVNARDLRVKVIGEGANLAATQRGRIEFANLGGRVNTDFIDNSGGVDCSDHEVNIKILLNKVVSGGDLTLKQRNRLLEQMTDEVAALVLRDNYLQSQAISETLAEGFEFLDQQTHLMKTLERAGKLDRAIELLPHDEELIERQGRREGLNRPELAVLLCYAKIQLYDDLLASDLPDDPALEDDLRLYFPGPVRKRFDPSIVAHPLRREIVATHVTNSLINRTGPTFVSEMMDKSGMGPADVARAYLVVRDSFSLRELWSAIQALDNKVDAATQTAMLIQIRRMVERETAWVLRYHGDALDIGRLIARFRPDVRKVVENLDAILYDEARAVLAGRVAQLKEKGVPEALAWRTSSINVVGASLDLIRIAELRHLTVGEVAPIYFTLGHRLGIAWLRDSAIGMPARNGWQKQAVTATVDDLNALQAELTSRVLDGGEAQPGLALLDAWTKRRQAPIDRIDHLVAELKAVDVLDVAMLTVASRRLRGLVTG